MIPELEYNTEREHLIIPEYGRHLQKMINHAKQIENREERNNTVKAIIGVMGNLQPHLRDVPDFQHKLWDQLFIMSNFDLDVDSPYTKPLKEVLQSRPEPLEYPQNHPKYRFYGNNIKSMIVEAKKIDNVDLKNALISTIANHMKKCFLTWNKDTVEDKVIFNHLYELSDGDFDLRSSQETLSEFSNISKSKRKGNYSKKPKRKYSNNKKRY